MYCIINTADVTVYEIYHQIVDIGTIKIYLRDLHLIYYVCDEIKCMLFIFLLNTVRELLRITTDVYAKDARLIFPFYPQIF